MGYSPWGSQRAEPDRATNILPFHFQAQCSGKRMPLSGMHNCPVTAWGGAHARRKAGAFQWDIDGGRGPAEWDPWSLQ